MCQGDISVVDTEGNCLWREWNRYSLDRGSLAIWVCQVVSSVLPWSRQGLLVSRVFVVMKLVTVLINQDDLHLFLYSVRIMSLGALELTMKCHYVSKRTCGTPVHGIGFVCGALVCDVSRFHCVPFLGDPLLPAIWACCPDQGRVNVSACTREHSPATSLAVALCLGGFLVGMPVAIAKLLRWFYCRWNVERRMMRLMCKLFKCWRGIVG